jgi:hypothetical protein
MPLFKNLRKKVVNYDGARYDCDSGCGQTRRQSNSSGSNRRARIFIRKHNRRFGTEYDLENMTLFLEQHMIELRGDDAAYLHHPH